MINLEEVSIIEAKDHNKLIISNLSQFYQHDLSPYFDFSPENFPKERGLYDPLEYFDLYWSEKDRYPFLVTCKERPIGFALVNKIGTSSNVDWNMAEFFIIRSCRKKGIGSYVAHQIMQNFPGTWEIAVIPENQNAFSFWNHFLHKSFKKYKIEKETRTIKVPKPHKMKIFRLDTR